MVPDEIQPDSDVFILLQNPGADEERYGIPACGKTGQVLNTQFIPLSGLKRGSVSVGNVIKCRLGNSNVLPTGAVLTQAVKHCTQAYLRFPETTKGIIAQGKLAFDYANTYLRGSALPLPGTLSAWRGFILPDTTPPTFITVHTADTFYDTRMSWVSAWDWQHLGELRRWAWTYPTPPRQHESATTVVDETTEHLFQTADEDRVKYLVVDTEFISGTSHLTLLGIGFIVQDHCNQKVPFDNQHHGSERDVHSSDELTPLTVLSIDWTKTTYPVKDWIKSKLKTCLAKLPVVFQNAMADIPQLEANLGIHYEDYYRIEDTMLAHAVLWSELPHTLDFLASLYGQYGKFKHLQYIDELRYNYGDVVDTYLSWDILARSLKEDRAAEAIYREQSLKLLPILLQAKKDGIRVNKERVLEIFNEYAQLIRRLSDYAELAVGYQINLNSGPQIKSYLYDQRGLPIQFDKDTKRPTTDDDAIARLRTHVGPIYDTSSELTFDRVDERHYSLLQRVAAGADPILEARALWAGAWQVVNNYIVGLAKGVYGEANKNKRKKARESYWRHGLTDEAVVKRIYPNFAIHAQKTGRWSTTDPPLAQLPSDLRDIICSDEDEVCLSWDWSAIEPRILQALTGSVLLKKTFDENFDLHTWTVCYMFGYDIPPDLVDPHRNPSCETWRMRYNWKGKDDPRRVFAKQARYEMWYGGTGSNAAAAAAQFGLNARDLRVALSKLATSDPAYYTWKLRLEAEVKKTSLIRTFMGRPRRFLSHGSARLREALDQPMQGGVSDIFNTTAVLLSEQCPQLRWGWGMHDSQKWYAKQCDVTSVLLDKVQGIITRPHMINGQETRFPAELEIILPPEQGNQVCTPAQYFALVNQ